MHAGDRIPGWILHSQEWLYRWVAPDLRTLVAASAIIVAFAALVVLSSIRILVDIFEALDVIALVSLFLVNWLGNGGALVPIPGARLLGLLMIFSQAALLPAWEVLVVGGGAMALGLLSYFILGARTQAAYARGDADGAARLARDAGMMPDPAGAPVTDQPDGDPLAAAATFLDAPSDAGGMRRRFSSSLLRTERRARPVIEKHGTWGLFWLCLTPTVAGTAAAFISGILRLGFTRFLVAALAAKYLLAGIVVLGSQVFSQQAQALELPF